MANTDEYIELKTEAKNKLFIELFELKAQKKLIDARIKVLETGYKEETIGLKSDKFFITSTGVKFSFKKSMRVGSVDTKRMELDGINVEQYRKESTSIVTLRRDA